MVKNNLISRLGIQSWCFREFKETSKVIRALDECGVNHLEICPVHIDVKKNAAEVLKEYTDAGIRISSFGVSYFTKDEEAARKVFEFAKMDDFSTIGADLGEGGLETAEKLCREYGKKIAIHNHGRKHTLGSVEALGKLFAKSSPNVGLCLDTAWMLDSGEDPVAVAEKFKERLYGLHIKDFVFDRAGKPEDVVVGTGNLNLEKLASFLSKINFGGYITLEYEGDKDNPVPALKKCVEKLNYSFRKEQLNVLSLGNLIV